MLLTDQRLKNVEDLAKIMHRPDMIFMVQILREVRELKTLLEKNQGERKKDYEKEE